jgi:hypothetical protein
MTDLVQVLAGQKFRSIRYSLTKMLCLRVIVVVLGDSVAGFCTFETGFLLVLAFLPHGLALLFGLGVDFLTDLVGGVVFFMAPV